MNKLLPFYIVLSLLLNSCAKDVDNEVQVYNNDFETADLKGITNGTITVFAGTKILGGYNNNGFSLTLGDLSEHDLLDISFDLYIHDNWVGNQNLSYNENTPDIWYMKLNGKTFINTTFSNQDCQPGNICPPQSYPADYPNNNHNPRFGADRTNLPGLCRKVNETNGSTLYRIHKVISHAEKTLLIECFDQYTQKSVLDNKCEASWSVDNIKIKIINLR